MTTVFKTSLNAQNDGFFTVNYSSYEERNNDFGILPGLPNSYNLDYDVDAPIGSGILLLTGFAFAYVNRKSKKRI